MSEDRYEPGRVVVGLDGSEAAVRALHWAYHHAQLTGLGLHVVHTYDLDPGPNPYAGAYAYVPDHRLAAEISESEARWREERYRIAEQHAESMVTHALGMVAGEAGGPEVTVSREVVGGVRAAEVLLDRARDAALLVVGSRGLGGFRGLLLGSVSQQCVQHAACPVVVVRAGQE